MNFLTNADSRIVFAFWLGVGVVVMALLMMMVILIMRRVVENNDRNHLRAATFWRRVLAEAMHGLPASVPRLARGDLAGFVDVWNDLHDTLRDGDNPGMSRVAAEVGLEQKLYLALDHGGFHNRVMSIIAMGYLKSQTHFDKLARCLDDRSPIVSLSAARALMKIDPARAVEMVLPHIITRGDWSQSGVAQILQETDPAVVSRELGEVTLQANDGVASRLVRFLADVSPEEASPVIRRIFSTAHDDHLLATCLQVMTDREDLALVRPLLGHSRWHVRMHAATTVGRLGEHGDDRLLLPLLADEQWWVRYRAAQALTKLSFLAPADLQRIRGAQSDRFACDILDHVLAENAIGARA